MKIELTKEWCMNMAKIEARAAELHEGCQMPMEQARAIAASEASPDWYARGQDWGLADALTAGQDGDWTLDDIARAFAAGAAAGGARYRIAAAQQAASPHWSDCATNNAPAYPAGLCDCLPSPAMCRAAVEYMNGADVYSKVPREALDIEEGIYREVWRAMQAAQPQQAAECAQCVTLHVCKRDGCFARRVRAMMPLTAPVLMQDEPDGGRLSKALAGKLDAMQRAREAAAALNGASVLTDAEIGIATQYIAPTSPTALYEYDLRVARAIEAAVIAKLGGAA